MLRLLPLTLATALLIAISARAADLTISNAATSNVVFSGGVFTGSATSAANLNVSTLVAALASAPITVRTVSGGAGNGDIFVANNIAWSSSSALRLEAYRNIALGTSTITNTFGATVQLRADSTGTGVGTISAATGNVTTTGGIVEAFYNPIVFGIPQILYTGGTTPTGYMLVNSLTNLQNITTNLSGNYALARDLDASATSAWNSGNGFLPIGTAATQFAGRFSGEDQIIDGLFVNRPAQDYAALFGYTASNSAIRKIRLTNVNVTGGNYVGALIGFANNATTVSDASSTGTVVATGNGGGGLIGAILGGTVTRSKSTASVTLTSGGMYAGGLIGLANAFTPSSLTISDCYATGTVMNGTGSSTGGLIGFNNNTSTVTRVYSSGGVLSNGVNLGGLIGFNNVAPVTNAFWDTQRSGVMSSAAGTGLNTAQMKQQASFTGFDFVNVWTIVDGLTYPHFGASEPPSIGTSLGATAFVEADTTTSTPVAIEPAISFSDPDTATFASASVTISGGFQTAEDVLAFTNDGVSMGDITASYDAATGILTMTSAGAAAAQWQSALGAVTYTNDSDTPDTTARTIRFTISDGTSTRTADKTVTVAATNDTPHVSAPGSIGVTAGVAATITGIVLSDVDAGNATVTATLTVNAGTLSAASGGGVTAGGSASSMTLNGSIANINGFIAASNITFTTASAAIVTLTIDLDDGGNTGEGGAKSDSASTLLQVAPAAPVLLSATASSDSAVTVTWTPVAGATGYEIHRSVNIATPFAYAGSATSAENTFNDTGRDANTSYLYKVLATGSAGPSQLSNVDAATTTPFTDATLENVAVKGIHILEIRKAVNAMLIAANETATFSTADPANVAIAAQDIIDLRAALDFARLQIGLPALSYSNPAPTPAVTAIRAADFYDLRSGVE